MLRPHECLHEMPSISDSRIGHPVRGQPRETESASEEYAIAELIGQSTDKLRLTWRQPVCIHVAPIALVEMKGLLGSNRARRIAIPHEHFQLGELRGNDDCDNPFHDAAR